MKKVLSLVLAMVLVFGLGSVAFAANLAVGSDESVDWGLGYSYYSGGVTNKYANVSTVAPGDDTIIEFAVFPASGYNGVQEYVYVTRQLVRRDKIDVKMKVSEGSKAIDSVSIKYDGKMTIWDTDKDGNRIPGTGAGYAKDPSDGNTYKTRNVSDAAYIKVEYIDPFVSTKEIDFDYTVYLTKDKKRLSETEVQIVGTLENEEQFVDENDDMVYTYDIPVVEAEAYIKSIEVDLGEGVSIFTKMFDGKRYYGQVTQEIEDADDEIVSKYPAIDTIYKLSTINLNAAGNYVKIDVDDKMYVYNADLQYIGTTNDKLPYSTKYYVASVELDVDDADIDSIPNDSDNENAPSGGDDVPTNVNENPGTGR